jgi:hypothetical protein
VPEVREVVFICRISPNRSVSHDISIIFVRSIVIFWLQIFSKVRKHDAANQHRNRYLRMETVKAS